MTALRLDPSASRLLLRTRSTGVFARLAHDLEVQASQISGRASLDGGAWSGEITISVAGLIVAGTVRSDVVDPAGLSADDRREIEQKLRDQILRGTSEVRVRASGRTRDRAEGQVELASGRGHITAPLTTRERPGGIMEVSGACWVSMRELGIPEVKGPLGAFKLRDEIEVRFELTLRPGA